YLAVSGIYWYLSAAIGDTLFLSKFGDNSDETLPWVYIGTACVTVPVTLAADRLQNRFSKLRLVCFTEIFLAFSIIAFRYFILTDRGWVYYGLVIWLE